MIGNWISLVFFSFLLGMAGIIMGFILAEPRYRKAAGTLLKFAGSFVFKALARTFSPAKRRFLEEVDKSFSSLSEHERMVYTDPIAFSVATRFKHELEEVFCEKLMGIYLFGSRARGTHVLNSDLDLLLIFDQTVVLSKARLQVYWAVLQVLFQHGLLIQPRVINRHVLDQKPSIPFPVIQRALQTGIEI